MIAVIPCAGGGVRMRPLTLTTPKTLLEVGGKPILEHIFNSLPDAVDEVILVVGYFSDQIKNRFGKEFKGKKILYTEQPSPKGTWHALNCAKPFLDKERFLFLFGDDILDKESITRCLRHDLALLVKEVPDPRRFGVVIADEKGKVLSFIEKPQNPSSKLAATGVKVLDFRIFNYSVPAHPINGEFYDTAAVAQLAKDHEVFMEHAQTWLSIATPEDLVRVNEYFKALTKKS